MTDILKKFSYHFWVIAVLAMTHDAYPQGFPGHWYKVTLPQSSKAMNPTLDFAFRDSLNGLCVSLDGMISSTTDGGEVWQLDKNLGTVLQGNAPYDEASFIAENNLECTAPRQGFFFSGTQTLSISPSGIATLINTCPPGIEDTDYGYHDPYSTLAEKMYDTSYGFRLVTVNTHKDMGLFDPPDTTVLMMLVTHNGWHTSSIYGGMRIDTFTSFYIYYPSINNGLIVDSNDAWAEEDAPILDSNGKLLKDPKFLLHTSNAGISWDTINPFESYLTSLGTGVADMFANSKTREVYCLLNGSKLDYTYSSDYGTSWRLDSTFPTFGNGSDGIGFDSIFPNVWLMVNSAPGILWAILGQGGELTHIPYPPGDVMGMNSNRYSRKIAYSSDNGMNWTIDSTTFRDDSLENMHWLDARHGWIASWSHDSSFMWYFQANPASVIEHGTPIAYQLVIYPNPAQSFITINTTATNVTVTDVLGRALYCPFENNRLDVSRLPRGVYFISSGRQHAEFAKE